MNIYDEHAQMAARLSKPGQAILDTLSADDAEALHMALGVIGEAVELSQATDAANYLEEAGDLAFFLTRLGQLHGVTEFWDCGMPPASEGVLSVAETVANLVKKKVIYRKNGLDAEIAIQVRLLAATLEKAVYAKVSLRIGDVLRANIEKLDGKRYKGGYSDAAAQARADKGGSD